jgi:hypothetical protein
VFTLSRTLALANAIAVALALVSAGPAAAQGEATIGVQSNADLAFGAIAPGLTGGSVTVTPTGGRTSTGVVLLGGGFGAASYTVTIDGGNPHYTIVLPSAITLQGPSNATMTVDSITSDPVGGGKTAPPQRIGHFTVGGTLRVSANQPSGVYAAPFLVTVNLGN